MRVSRSSVDDAKPRKSAARVKPISEDTKGGSLPIKIDAYNWGNDKAVCIALMPESNQHTIEEN